MGIFSWLRGVVAKLISKNDVESALQVRTAMSDEMSRAISLWAAMYRDSPPWKSKTVQTLNLPATIASKVAKMVTLEAELQITGGPRAAWLQEQLAPVWDNIRNFSEQAIAKGGLVFKPYISGQSLSVDVVQADRFFPTGFDSNGAVSSGVFVAQITQGQTIYTRLERHEFKNGVHTITHRAFRSTASGFLGSPCSLTDVPEWANIQSETQIRHLIQPLFVYWRMPFANNIDESSPIGVSIYSKAAETLEQIDRQYSRLIWEFESGERTIHASADLFRTGKSGRVELPAGRERQYRLLEDGLEDGKNLFQEFSPAFRDASLLNGFNALLRQMEQQCGLAAGTFSDPQAVAKTATEVASTKQESYTTVADIQKSLETALRRLVISMDALATAGKLAPGGSFQIACDWDDSIVNEPSERKKQFWQYVQAGKFPFWRYLMEFESYTEQEARAIQAESSRTLGDPYA